MKKNIIKTIIIVGACATSRMYATQTPGLDSEDKEEIYEVANKFK